MTDIYVVGRLNTYTGSCYVLQATPSAVCVSIRTPSVTRRGCAPVAERSYSHRSCGCLNLSLQLKQLTSLKRKSLPCAQAPNVSLQQLIASFAAQSRQLGVRPAPRQANVMADSAASIEVGASSTVLPDTDQLTSCRCAMLCLKPFVGPTFLHILPFS